MLIKKYALNKHVHLLTRLYGMSGCYTNSKGQLMKYQLYYLRKGGGGGSFVQNMIFWPFFNLPPLRALEFRVGYFTDPTPKA